MFIPVARERVYVAGRREVFFVLTVNPEECWADVIPLNGLAYVEHHVPFVMMEPIHEGSLCGDG